MVDTLLRSAPCVVLLAGPSKWDPVWSGCSRGESRHGAVRVEIEPAIVAVLQLMFRKGLAGLFFKA
jgi:hypothetical protein